MDIIRASDWITVSWNYFHDHWKSSLIGNNDQFRDIDFGHLHVTYHHNYWKNAGTRGPAGRFGHQHIYNNLYQDFLYQAIHSRSDNQVLVEGNVFTGNTRTALTTYGLVVPEDSPNTGPDGDYELDGFANLGAKNDFGKADVVSIILAKHVRRLTSPEHHPGRQLQEGPLQVQAHFPQGRHKGRQEGCWYWQDLNHCSRLSA